MRLPLIIILALVGCAHAQERWYAGRATYFGLDKWTIHKGFCGFGQLAEDVATGWDVASLSDQAYDYRNSCGRCKAVRCKAMAFQDGYGAYLDRMDVCYDPDATVVVMITDRCRCVYPNNAYSNKRWCCGDMYHMDLSVWAFEKLADIKWGVIGIEWRDVRCDYRPAKPARKPWGDKTAMPDWYKPRPGWNRWMDKRLAAWKHPNYDGGRTSGRKMF